MKRTSTNHILAFIIAIFMIITYILSPFASSNAYAASSAPSNITVVSIDVHWDGTEDAMDDDAFESPMEQQLYKCWSVLMSMESEDGKNQMTEEMACGALGCWWAESSFSSWIVEGKFADFSTWEDVNDYVDKYSLPFKEDHDAVTVDVLKHGYGVSDAGIAAGRAGQKMQGTNHILSGSTYFPAEYNHTGYLGLGLGQATGTRAASLIEFGENNDCDWWIIENQLTWIYTPTEDGGEPNYPWDRFLGDDYSTISKDIEKSTRDFFGLYEMPGARSGPGTTKSHESFLTGKDGNRVGKAYGLYDALHGKGWDEEYGKMILEGAGLTASTRKKGIIDRSILFTFASKALYYPLNSGFILPISENDEKEMYNKNSDVYKGLVKEFRGEENDSKKYCLFELYGEDIHWYRYLGEASYMPNLGDHVFSGVFQDKVDELKSPSSIIYKPNNYISCRVYKNRPFVLTPEQRILGYEDPRVVTLLTSYFTGDLYVISSLELSIAKYVVSTISYLTSKDLLTGIKDGIETLLDAEIWNILKPIIAILLAFAMIFFLISLVSKVKNYTTGKSSSPKDIIERFVIGFLMLGIAFLFIAAPKRVNNVSYKVFTFIDDLFDEGLAEANKKDDVISVSDPNLAVRATLWRTAIFEPWCKGQFNGKSYNKLYTQYAEDLENGQSKMAQDMQEVDKNDVTGKAFFNSAECTGDVWVSIGEDTKIRNWAAFLYSCGSQYHIDATIDEQAIETVKAKKNKSTYKRKNVFSKTRSEMIEEAQSYVGVLPYVLGGNSLTTGTDCSGFVKLLYEKHAGITLPRTADDIVNSDLTIEIDYEELQPGDLVAYKNRNGGNYYDHITMYIGNAQVVHESNSREGTKVSNIDYRQNAIYLRVTSLDVYDVKESGIKSSDTTNDNKDKKYTINLDEPVVFPVANTTAYDSSLMADTFRVIDAQMNIAPQQFADGTSVPNYTNAKYLNPLWMIFEGFIAIMKAGLLLFLLPPIFKRIKNLILLLVFGVTAIYYSIVELFHEGNFKKLGNSVVEAITGYFIASLQIFLLVSFYKTFVSQGLFFCLIYIILAILILSFNSKDFNQFLSDTRRKKMVVKQTATQAAGSVKATATNAKINADKVATGAKNLSEKTKTVMNNASQGMKNMSGKIKSKKTDTTKSDLTNTSDKIGKSDKLKNAVDSKIETVGRKIEHIPDKAEEMDKSKGATEVNITAHINDDTPGKKGTVSASKDGTINIDIEPDADVDLEIEANGELDIETDDNYDVKN